jgi:hypothetical protein
MKKYAVIFILAAFFFAARVSFLKMAVFGDGVGYYILTNTIAFEKKLDFYPALSHFSHEKINDRYVNRVFWKTEKTVTGLNNHPWLVGTSLFWLPPVFLLKIVNHVFCLGQDRFSLLFESTAAYSGMVYFFVGLYCLERYLNFFFKKRTVNIALLMIILTSIASYYVFFEPALSHQISFFIICVLLYKTKDMDMNLTNHFLVGLSCGLLAIVRVADIIFLIPVLYALITRNKKQRLLYLTGIIGGFALGILPQIIFQKILYGSFFVNPYLIGEKGVFQPSLSVGIFNNLFSEKRGLYFWSPTLLVSTIGLIWGLFDKKYGPKPKTMLLALAVFALLVGYWTTEVSAGFGNRFYIAALPYFAFGLCFFNTKIENRRFLSVLIFFALFFWNWLLVLQFTLNGKTLTSNKGFNAYDLAVGQLITPVKIFKLIREKGYNKTINQYFIQ